MNTPDISRRTFLHALAFAGFALQQPPTPIQTTKITNNLTMLGGDGGNVGVLMADDSVLMVDSGLAMRAGDIVRVVQELSPTRIAILFNTHFHFDHVGANEMLGRTGTKIMAHENVKKVLSSPFKDEAFARTFDPLKPEGLPTATYTAGGKLTFGKNQVLYTHIAEAH